MADHVGDDEILFIGGATVLSAVGTDKLLRGINRIRAHVAELEALLEKARAVVDDPSLRTLERLATAQHGGTARLLARMRSLRRALDARQNGGETSATRKEVAGG